MRSARNFLLVICILFLPLCFLRLRSVQNYQIPENKEIKIRGKITKQPYLKDSYQIIYVGPLVVKTGRFPSYFYGQKIEIVGKFRKRLINGFRSLYVSYFPTIQSVKEPRNKIGLRAFLYKFRGRVEQAVAEVLPEPQAGLLLGIVFGAKKQMSSEFWQALQKTGTLHIVVASGQNVTMVAKFLIWSLIGFLNRRRVLVLVAFGVVFYILMVGAEPPVVRAGIMAGIGFLAQVLGREQEGTISLVLAAGVMLLFSPLLLFDIGFQLSFAATAGLIWIYPVIRRNLKLPLEILVSTSDSACKDSFGINRLGSRKGACPVKRSFIPGRKVKSHKIGLAAWVFQIFPFNLFGELLATTIAAQLAVMPIILVNFGQLSPISPLVNAVVLWVVPLVMVLGSVTAVLALVIKPLAQVLSWFVWVLLSYFVKVIEVSSTWSLSSLDLSGFSGWWVMGYYGVLIGVISLYKKRFNSSG